MRPAHASCASCSDIRTGREVVLFEELSDRFCLLNQWSLGYRSSCDRQCLPILGQLHQGCELLDILEVRANLLLQYLGVREALKLANYELIHT